MVGRPQRSAHLPAWVQTCWGSIGQIHATSFTLPPSILLLAAPSSDLNTHCRLSWCWAAALALCRLHHIDRTLSLTLLGSPHATTALFPHVRSHNVTFSAWLGAACPIAVLRRRGLQLEAQCSASAVRGHRGLTPWSPSRVGPLQISEGQRGGVLLAKIRANHCSILTGKFVGLKTVGRIGLIYYMVRLVLLTSS